jgi:hypothetical protein
MVILPTNVFGFNQIDDKITYVSEIKKDQIEDVSFGIIQNIDAYFVTLENYNSDELGDLNLRYEPNQSFMGDEN